MSRISFSGAFLLSTTSIFAAEVAAQTEQENVFLIASHPDAGVINYI